MALKYWLPMTDGTLHNQGVSNITLTNNNVTSNSNGKLGKCVYFNGSAAAYADGITVGNNLTVCFWAKANTVHSGYIFQLGNAATANQVQVALRTEASNQQYIAFIGNTSFTSGYNIGCNTTDWNHYCMVIEETTLRIYINGTYKSSHTISSYYSGHRLSLGQYYSGTNFNGYINDFRLYDNVLSPSDIKRISQGLVLHYSLSNRGFGNENLLTRYVTPGQASPTSTATAGRTKYYGDYGIIIPAQESADTYFRLFLKEKLTLNEVYTISCQASGLLNGSYIRFPLFAQGNTSMGILNIDHNGLCSLTFTMTYTNQTAATAGSETVYICFLDDSGRNYVSGQGTITLTNFKIEKGNKVTPFIPHSSDPLYSKLELDNNIEYDLSGYQYNGTRSGVTPSSDAPRNFGATYFDGIDDMILINDLYGISSILNDCATISFWIKPQDENGARSIYFSAYSNTSWSIEKSTANTIRSWWNGSPDLNCSNAVITDGVWQHVCIVKNGSSNLKVYINGELKYTQGGYTFENKTFSTTWRIGRDTRSNDGTPYHGLMTDFRLYSTALSAEDVSELYGGGVA